MTTCRGMVLAGMALLIQAVCPQDPKESSRALWDSQFLRQRPVAPSPARKAPETRPARPSPASQEALVGFTVWRLRRSALDDVPGARVLVHGEKADQEWTPERVPSNAPLAEGDRFRFAIESARPGHLYVIDREQYRDGSLGEPYLVFPTSKIRGGRNRVLAGTVVEFPSWDDQPPYVWLKRSRPDHVGEVLTILVTPEPLADVKVGAEPLKLAAAQVAAWEQKWGAETKRLGGQGRPGQTYTAAEKEAATGARSLTSTDPAPETLFLVQARDSQPVLVNVPLQIGK